MEAVSLRATYQNYFSFQKPTTLTPVVALALAALAGLGVYLVYRFYTLRQKNVKPLNPVFSATQFPGLPEWLTSRLQSKNIPLLNFEKGQTIENLLGQMKTSLAFSEKQIVALYMKLKVTHISINPSDNHAEGIQNNVQLPQETTEQPFICYAALKEGAITNDTWWLLLPEHKSIMHRNAPHSMLQLFQSFSPFHLQIFTNLHEVTINQLMQIEEEDQLPSEHRHNLAWIVLRLLENKSVSLREHAADRASIIGHWRIELAQ